jgi:hypothetical protein
LSAAGHDEQPWLVKSSITPRGSADAVAAAAIVEATTASDNATRRLFMPTSTSSSPTDTFRRLPAP